MKTQKFNIAFFIFGIAMLTYLVLDFGLARIMENIIRTGWWFIPILGIWFVIYMMNTLAWHYIIGHGHNSNFREILRLMISGFAINYITPVVGLAGEPYKVINISTKIGIHKASSSVILYNMMHILSHFYFWLATIVLVVAFTSLTLSAYIISGICFLVLIFFIIIFYAWHRKGVVYTLLGFLSRIPFLKKSIKRLQEKNETLNQIDDQIRYLYNRRKKSFYIILGIEFIARIIGSFEFYFIMKAIGHDVSIMEAIYISAASSLMANLFFFIPLQLGTREGSLYLVFDSLRLTPELGVFVSLVTRIREFFWILVGLILMRITSVKNKRRIVTSE